MRCWVMASAANDRLSIVQPIAYLVLGRGIAGRVGVHGSAALLSLRRQRHCRLLIGDGSLVLDRRLRSCRWIQRVGPPHLSALDQFDGDEASILGYLEPGRRRAGPCDPARAGAEGEQPSPEVQHSACSSTWLQSVSGARTSAAGARTRTRGSVEECVGKVWGGAGCAGLCATAAAARLWLELQSSPA